MLHAWTVPCTKCIVDPDSKNSTLVEVVEQINVGGHPGFPAMIPIQIDVVSTFFRSNQDQGERGQGRFVFLHPGGRRDPNQEFLIDLSEYFRGRITTRIAGLPLSGPGLYFFLIELFRDATGDWSEVARVPLIVQQG